MSDIRFYAGVAATNDKGQVLLIRRSKAPAQGAWAIPMGAIEPGESTSQAAVREAKEETGLDVALEGIVGVFTANEVHVTVYCGKIVRGALRAQDDASDACLVPSEELPVHQKPPTSSERDVWAVNMNQDILRAVQDSMRNL